METDLLLRQYCKQLHLPALAAHYRHFAEDAARENLTYDRFCWRSWSVRSSSGRPTRKSAACAWPVSRSLMPGHFRL